MSDVPTLAVPQFTPHAETIQHLEECLELARRGEMRGFIYIGIATDRRMYYGIAPGEWVRDYLALAGMTQWLQQECIRRWDDEAPDAP